MPIPDAKATFLDGALGLAADSSARVQVKLGVSTAGTVNVLDSASDISTLQSKLGAGPLVEACARVLSRAGGPVLFMRVNASTPGSAPAPTATKTGTATLALTGSVPYDAYELVLEILQGGATLAAGTATFRYSLDGGRTFSAEISVPTAGTYAIPGTGISLTWTYSAGTAFVAGDKWTSTCVAPAFTTSDLATAVAALLADNRTWFMLHVVGPAADLAGTRALFAALSTHMATAEAAHRYAAALMEAPDGTDASLLANTTGLGDLADVRVSVAAGFEQLVSPISGRIYKRSTAWRAAEELSATDPSQDIGALANGAGRGVAALYRDERVTPGLDAGRFITARSFLGRQGYYLTRGRMFAPAGSDYAWWTNRRVMDVFAAALRDGALKFLLAKVRTNANGTIEEKQAQAIEQYLDRKCRDALGSDVVDLDVAIDRTVNLTSTGKMKVLGRAQPFGYPSDISLELGFTSPAVAAAKA